MNSPSVTPSPHPRWPEGMTLDVQLVIADEVDITLAGFAGRKELGPAITAYAENLGGFIPEDIRGGFRESRRQAVEFAPTASQVLACVAAVRKARLASAPRPDELPFEHHDPTEVPAWKAAREALRPRSFPVLEESCAGSMAGAPNHPNDRQCAP